MWLFIKDRFVNTDAMQHVRLRQKGIVVSINDYTDTEDTLDKPDVVVYWREGYSETFPFKDALPLLNTLLDDVYRNEVDSRDSEEAARTAIEKAIEENLDTGTEPKQQ